MFCFVGLGNFGKKYENTVHNAGFITVEGILGSLKISPNWKEKFSGLFCFEEINGNKILFIKPQTYMNNSGVCVSQFVNFYKIPINNVYIFHDEIDLPKFKVKIKTGGGNAGHNGLKSLDSHIGKNYHRIRIGVGKPQHKEDVSNYVLSTLKSEEIDELYSISNLFFKNINFLLENNFFALNKKF